MVSKHLFIPIDVSCHSQWCLCSTIPKQPQTAIVYGDKRLQFAIFCYWKWHCFICLPIKNAAFPWFFVCKNQPIYMVIICCYHPQWIHCKLPNCENCTQTPKHLAQYGIYIYIYLHTGYIYISIFNLVSRFPKPLGLFGRAQTPKFFSSENA